MNILAGNEAYKLDKLVVNALGNDRQISWRYFGQSTHFLITISDAFSVFSLNDVEAYLKKQGICDEDFIAKRELSLSDENNVIKKVVLISTQIYTRDQKGYKFNPMQLTNMKKIPLKFTVYACVVREGKTIEAYEALNEEQVVYLPLVVRYTQELKGLGTKTAHVHFEPVVGYRTGSFRYRIPGQSIAVPLTEGTLGRNLEIRLPGKDELDFYVAKEYAQYYKLERMKRK